MALSRKHRNALHMRRRLRSEAIADSPAHALLVFTPTLWGRCCFGNRADAGKGRASLGGERGWRQFRGTPKRQERAR